MVVISGAPRTLRQGLYSKVAHYRHRVFIEQLGWQLPTLGEGEQDQFDRSDTVYVVAQDEDGHIFGCARLLPTTGPYLLSEVFPQLLNGLPRPCSPDIWELSRFASVDFNSRMTLPLGQYSSSIAIQLLRESIACAAEHGARRLITVSPIGIERLLRRAGIHAHRAGPPMVVDGHPIVACWIEVARNIVPAKLAP